MSSASRGSGRSQPSRPLGNSEPRRTRHLSIASNPTYNRPSSSTSRQHTHESSPIVSPVPTRHLLQTSETHQWLNSPPLSPWASRMHSPVTAGSSATPLSLNALLELRDVSIPLPKVEDIESSMGKRWVRWMHKNGMKHWVVPLSIAAAMCFKWAITLGPHSGEGTPPLYGDYEAHRHWMELTIHLPLEKWYTYDLQYWGLDYPPLTAYISWVFGIIGSWIQPEWFALGTSRGTETPASRVFMRSTVLIMDSLVYVPALVMFVQTWQRTRSKRTQNMALLILLLQPAPLLIDFGHFQYNLVMLGFTLHAINLFALGRDVLGAICFVLSLGSKQMSLYYAPAIGSYLLGKCIHLGPTHGTRLFLRLALTTVLTTLALFLPFLPPFSPLPTIVGPIVRLFPFHRGLFEDKVATFWCLTDVFAKWRTRLTRAALVRASTALTLAAFLPAVVGLIAAGWRIPRAEAPSKGGDKRKHAEKGDLATENWTPTLPLLPYAMLTSSLAFFLFSFHVHEKTLLLPLLPMTALLSGSAYGSTVYEWGMLVNNVGVFSMWPLLKRDGQGIQYVATLLLWNRLLGYNPFRFKMSGHNFVTFLSLGVHLAALMLHALELIFPPPARYPYLFPQMNVMLSTPVLALAWLWSIKCGVQTSWALNSPAPTARAHPTVTQEVTAEAPTSTASVVQGGSRMGGKRWESLGYSQGRKRKVVKPSSSLGHLRNE